MRLARLLLAPLALGVVFPGPAALGAAPQAALDRGDAAWARRAEGERDGRPEPGPIAEALRHYETALAESPESLEARWKLLRALHFAGDFALREKDERREVFERAREVSEAGLDQLDQALGFGERADELEAATVAIRLGSTSVAPRDVARLHFWAAINWGAWSRVVGLLAAVRRGVANRLHRYTALAVALEPGYEEGGPLRLLGRLHAELPRVPFLSGWVDRDRALPLVERARTLFPRNPGNRLLLALTLLDLAPERRAEALALLEQAAQLEPRPAMRIEDLAVRREARERLASERAR